MDDAPTPQGLDFINNNNIYVKFNNNNNNININNNNNNNEMDDEEDSKIVNSKEFNINYKEKNYIFKIYIKETKKYLYLEVMIENDMISYYGYKFEFNDLMFFDKIFKTCDNIDQAYDIMISNFNEDKNIIKDVKENKLIIKINLLQANRTVKEKEIILKKKYLKTEIIIDKLSKEINELKSVQNNMQNEINELKKEKKESEKLKQEIDILKNKINEYFDDTILKSSIIQKKEDFEFIKERLAKVKLNDEKDNHKISYELLYRAKRHGDRAKTFHSRCDGFHNTLIIIKTTEGLIFGGFTTESWEGQHLDKLDENAFCFSIDNHKIYNSIKGTTAIYASPSAGPTFQNCIFEVKDKCFEYGGKCDENISSHYNNIETEYEINGGRNEFLVEDMEIFSVFFE